MPQIRVHRLASVDSTNSEAQRLYQSGVREAVWIVAGEQTAGRGRLGRQWTSEPGNLYSTLLLPIEKQPHVAAQLGFVTALAVADAVNAIVSAHLVQLKWPNDCLIGGAKFSGILSEVLADGAVAIGCGINVAHAPEGTAYPVTHLQKHCDVELNEVFSRYSDAMERLLVIWSEDDGFAEIAQRWIAHAVGVGGDIQVKMHDTIHSGRFVGLAADGALQMEEGGKLHQIYAGDVRIAALEQQRARLS